MEPVTATTSSLLTTGTGMVGSAIEIVAKPIQAYTRSKIVAPRTDTVLVKHGQPSDTMIYGRPAALFVPTNLSIKEEPRSTFLTALEGSAAGVGGFFKHFTKGMYLDMPLAMTEGLRNAPRLYGGEVYQPGPIDDWMSGGVAAGKNFCHGIVEGIGGLVTTPVRGAQSGGTAGLAKGVGVGCLNMGTKVTSGRLPFGLHLVLYLPGRS